MKRYVLLFVLLFSGWGILGTDFVPRVEDQIVRMADAEIAALEAEAASLQGQIATLQAPAQVSPRLTVSNTVLVIALLALVGLTIALVATSLTLVQQWQKTKEDLAGIESELHQAQLYRDRRQAVLNQLIGAGPPARVQPQRSIGGY